MGCTHSTADAPISSVTGFDATKTTPGLAPKISSMVDDVAVSPDWGTPL